jgi:diguanylate cyclase (GGDEF)-like protein/PAS domain S-box-containing protein
MDVEKIKANETEYLINNENNYRKLFENCNAVMLVIDPVSLDILDANIAACNYYGYKKEEMLNLKITNINICSRKVVEESINSVLKENSQKFQFKHQLSNGEVRDVEVYSGKVQVNGKELLYSFILDISDRVRTLKELKESQNEALLQKIYFRQLFENCPEAIAILDNKGRVVSINQAFENLFHYKIDEILGKDIANVLCSPENYLQSVTFQEAANKGEIIRAEAERLNKEGQKIDVSLLVYSITKDDENIGSFVIYSDITERKEDENKLSLFAKIFDNNTEGIVVTDTEANIQWVNKAFTEITGYSEKEAIGKKTNLFKSGKHDKTFYKNMWESLLTTGHWQDEIWNRRKNGEIYPEQLSIFVIKNEKGHIANFAAIFRSIDEQKKREEKIVNMAYTDSLTKLYNRSYFVEKLNQELSERTNKKEKMAIIFLDLDNFKKLNDVLGHSVGDMALVYFGSKLRDIVRDNGIVTRIGGDEFSILLPNLSGEDEALFIAKEILDSFKQLAKIDSHFLYISSSIGISYFPDDGEDLDTLMKNADIAMYEAKKEATNRIKLYSPNLQKQVREEFLIDNYLKDIEIKSELYLEFQPIIELSKGKIIGAEALLRWNNKNLGRVSPGKFIKIAEKNRTILSIGKWVFYNVCMQIRKLLSRELSLQFITINVSVVQLEHESFSDWIKATLEEFGIPANMIMLEITETSLMENLTKVKDEIKKLHDYGVRVAIDDFGTGYSSLGQISKLRISELKIDKTFVDGIGDKEDESIISAIISMAKSLNIGIVAEGVENEKQLEFLISQKCEMVQGYYFSKPVSIEEIEALIKESPKKVTIYETNN